MTEDLPKFILEHLETLEELPVTIRRPRKLSVLERWKRGTPEQREDLKKELMRAQAGARRFLNGKETRRKQHVDDGILRVLQNAARTSGMLSSGKYKCRRCQARVFNISELDGGSIKGTRQKPYKSYVYRLMCLKCGTVLTITRKRYIDIGTVDALIKVKTRAKIVITR